MKTFAMLLVSLLFLSGCGEVKVNVAALQTELATTKTELTALQAETTKLKIELASAKARISELEPIAKKARSLPVRITSRISRASETNVYQFVNLSEALLPVRIKLHNPNAKRNQSFTPVLPPPLPAKPFEIGPPEGWIVAPGDELELSSEGYDVMTKRF
jgi:regulator of replication initiation timing